MANWSSTFNLIKSKVTAQFLIELMIVHTVEWYENISRRDVINEKVFLRWKYIRNELCLNQTALHREDNN